MFVGGQQGFSLPTQVDHPPFFSQGTYNEFESASTFASCLPCETVRPGFWVLSYPIGTTSHPPPPYAPLQPSPFLGRVQHIRKQILLLLVHLLPGRHFCARASRLHFVPSGQVQFRGIIRVFNFVPRWDLRT